MSRILVIEDNQDINTMLVESLMTAGYLVDAAYTGVEGLQAFKQQDYQAVLLDIMLPYKSGDEVLKEIRQHSMVPVLVISAKDMVSTKVDLLKLGADDYITKPFDLNEVVARVEAMLRRTQYQKEAVVLQHFHLSLYPTSKKVKIKEQEVELTAKEYKIIELLLLHKDKIFTKDNVYTTVWEEKYIGDDNAVKTHISNLRTKLRKLDPEHEYIETVWGLGYRICQK